MLYYWLSVWNTINHLVPIFCHQTVLGHGIYLSDKERKKIKQKGASISHCPNSNLSWVVCALKMNCPWPHYLNLCHRYEGPWFFCSIRSGIFNARQCLSEGIKVGLGTGASYCDKRNMYRYWSLGSPCVQSDYKKLVTQTTVYFLMISENKRKLYTQDHQPVHMCRKTWSVPYFDDVSRTSPYVHVYTCN